MKKSKRCAYFDGSLSVEKTAIRMVGFSKKLHSQLEGYQSSKQPIEVKDCEVKAARRGDKFESILKNDTKLQTSPKKFDLSKMAFDNAIGGGPVEFVNLIDVESKERSIM